MEVGSSFANPKHEARFKMLQGCTQEEGLLPDELMQGLKAMDLAQGVG